jgi:hypothetical protein
MWCFSWCYSTFKKGGAKTFAIDFPKIYMDVVDPKQEDYYYSNFQKSENFVGNL